MTKLNYKLQLTSYMDYNGLNKDILKINPKIRYSGVYYAGNVQLFEKVQKGVTRLFDTEQTQNTFIHSYMRWKSRQQAASVIGEPVYTITKYGKINRITMPCSPQGLLMVNTEPELDPNEIIDDIIELIKKHSDDPNYTPKQVYLG